MRKTYSNKQEAAVELLSALRSETVVNVGVSDDFVYIVLGNGVMFEITSYVEETVINEWESHLIISKGKPRPTACWGTDVEFPDEEESS